jgi:hypothetical protein
LNVPQLTVPGVTDYSTEMGNQYIRERTFEEIAAKLMELPKEDEPEEEKKEEVTEPDLNATTSAVLPPSSAGNQSDKKGVGKTGKALSSQGEADPTSEGEAEEAKEPEEPPFKPNDYLQKAEMEPPRDPEGNNTIHPDLLILSERIVEILDNALSQTLIWIIAEKSLHEEKVSNEGKELQDRSVEELDENLRKQWPRKGRLEVEIYQQRKSEISAHNKKYERHVRA